MFNGATTYAGGATLKCVSGGVDPKSRYTLSTGIFLVPYACYVKIFVSLTTGTGANAAQPVIYKNAGQVSTTLCWIVNGSVGSGVHVEKYVAGDQLTIRVLQACQISLGNCTFEIL